MEPSSRLSFCEVQAQVKRSELKSEICTPVEISCFNVPINCVLVSFLFSISSMIDDSEVAPDFDVGIIGDRVSPDI